MLFWIIIIVIVQVNFSSVVKRLDEIKETNKKILEAMQNKDEEPK